MKKESKIRFSTDHILHSIATTGLSCRAQYTMSNPGQVNKTEGKTEKARQFTELVIYTLFRVSNFKADNDEKKKYILLNVHIV